MKKFPLQPAHPERTCWGCDRFCGAGDMICGNGSERTQHPIELFGPDWLRMGLDPVEPCGVGEGADAGGLAPHEDTGSQPAPG